MFRRHIFQLGSRITATLLLALIIGGSTIEVTHGHSVGANNLNTEPSRNIAEPSLTEAARSIAVQRNAPARSSSRQGTASECLICQLHHNLSTTLLAQPATLDSPDLDAVGSLTLRPLHVLEFTTAQPGRAPPVSFLS